MASSAHTPIHLIHTIGDPSGIGPEITARYLSGTYLTNPFPLTIIGDITTLHRTARQYQLTLPDPRISPVKYIAIEEIHPNTTDSGYNHAEEGAIAYHSLVQAIQWIKHLRQTRPYQGTALVTGPINKANLHAAGYPYGGHTEILEELANQYFPNPKHRHQSDMLFVYRKLRMLLLTRHIPLSQVGQHLTLNQSVRSIQQLIAYLQRYESLNTPQLALFGVNPHAGEVGGDEEVTCLQPIIEAIHQTSAAHITGPLAADGAVRGLNANTPPYDAYIASYHDQGLIPVKLLAGHQAVNVTIGLPFLRTSVSHGTADAIVGQGVAQPESLIAAFALAKQLLVSPSL